MRNRPSQDRIQTRIMHRYHKLQEPLVELIQSLEDLLPAGVQLGETVELNSIDGELLISYKARPIRIVLRDKDQTVLLAVTKSPVKPRKRVTSTEQTE